MEQGLSDLIALAQGYNQKYVGLAYVSKRKDGALTRADKAAQLVWAGSAHRLGIDDRGRDQWEVAGHTCSIEGGTCDCEDRAANGVIEGKLCIHRLAAMLHLDWKGHENQALLSTMALFAGHPHADIILYREYRGERFKERAFLTGYACANMRAHLFHPGLCVEVTVAQFNWALAQIGWVLADLPRKHKNFDYAYRIMPKGADEHPVSELTFFYREKTEQMRHRSLADRFTVQQVADGGTGDGLPEWMMRKAQKLRSLARRDMETADEVFAGLPEDVRKMFV